MQNIGQYKIIKIIGEGTFGRVYMATTQDDADLQSVQPQSQKLVAIKLLLFEDRQLAKDGWPLIVYRETKLLKLLKHPNVVQLIDWICVRDEDDSQLLAGGSQKGSGGNQPKQKRPQLYYVFEYMEHDLAGVIGNQAVQLTPAVVKCYLKQMLLGLRYLHFNNIVHRDLKPANMLINNQGQLQITDFGLARLLDRERCGNYTPNVVTRWYRSPELCMGCSDYTTKIDVWSVGCILGELLLRRPLLVGQSDADQLHKIFELLGTPRGCEYPDWMNQPLTRNVRFTVTQSQLRYVMRQHLDAVPLMQELLELNPTARTSADLALDHDYLWQDPLPADKSMLPTFASSHEYNTKMAQDRRAIVASQAAATTNY